MEVATNLRFARSGMLKRIAPLALAVLVAALLLAVVFRDDIECAVLTAALRNATRFSVDIAGTHGVPGGIELSGLRARSESGDVALLAPRLIVTRRNGAFVVEAAGAQASVTAGSWQTPLEQVTALARRYGFGERGTTLRLQDCSLQWNGTAPAPWSLVFRGINGTLRRNGAATAYDLSAQLADGSASYPISGRTQSTPGGVTATWSAAQLPLTRLGALVPSPLLRLSGGLLRDVDLVSVRDSNGIQLSLKASAHVENGEASLSGDRVHGLRALHGALTLADGNVAVPKLAGQVDGVPLDLAGEIDGFAAPGTQASKAVRDLQQAVRLLAAIADQANLTSIHVETTAPGVAFAQYGMTSEHGPLAVQVVAIDPREPTLRWNTALSGDRIISSGERTSTMGLRTGAIAGVNGDYFDIGRTYQPQGLLIKDGELLRGPTDRMALVVHRDGSVTFAEFHMRGSLHTLHGDFPITQLNNWPAGEVTVITPAFGKELPAANGVTFVALEPLASAGAYRVASVTPMRAPVPVRFGLAYGQLAPVALHPGEEVDLKFGLDPPAGDAIAGIGGGPLLLRDGQWYEDPHAPAPDERDVRWPVIALARVSDGSLLLAAVDGRHPERSVGMTRPEFADLLRAFKATDAMALDSGGSVTMVSRAPGEAQVSVRNVPSDNSAERYVSDGLFLYSSAAPPALLSASPAPAASADP